MKKKLLAALAAATMIFALAGCGTGSLLDREKPVNLSVWHVYGEQAGSPMDLLIDEFNQTVGLEKGIIVSVTHMSNATRIGRELLEAQSDLPDTPELPDLFTCHAGDAAALGVENLMDWNEVFSPEELADFVPEFLTDGTVDGRLAVFPVSKSTHVLMLNGSQFARFSADTGVTLEDLSTWDGFFDAAARYYDWSGGTPFCAFDYLLRAVELYALEHGAGGLYTTGGWYDISNAVLKESWLTFARALAQGHIVVSDLYSNTQVMGGMVLGGIGSSAAILYYNDTVVYPDNSSEPMDLQVVPMPRTPGAQALMTQAGVGLAACRTDEKKAAAIEVFVRWLTQPERNLDFVAETGYMPVRSGAFDAIEGYTDFPEPQQAYRNLYDALNTMRQEYTPMSEARFAGYYSKVSTLYGALREGQQDYPARIAAGESADALAEEMWALLCSIG